MLVSSQYRNTGAKMTVALPVICIWALCSNINGIPEFDEEILHPVGRATRPAGKELGAVDD